MDNSREVEKQSYTNMADLWSLGVVAHALLTGDIVGRGKPGGDESIIAMTDTQLSKISNSVRKIAQQGLVNRVCVIVIGFGHYCLEASKSVVVQTNVLVSLFCWRTKMSVSLLAIGVFPP